MENTPMNGNAKRLESVDLQLSICHALLAVAYHECNAAEAALTAAEAELAQLRQQRHTERILLRTWVIRCCSLRPSAN